jgi:hypothetical protein
MPIIANRSGHPRNQSPFETLGRDVFGGIRLRLKCRTPCNRS